MKKTKSSKKIILKITMSMTNLFWNRNQTSHRLRNWSLVRPIGQRQRRRGRRRGVLPLIHLLGIRQLRRCSPTTAAQAPLIGLHLSPKDGQLDLLVIDLEVDVNLD